MYKDVANESTQKNQKIFEWKQYLDQQVVERRVQKELEMKQNQERDAMEEDQINKYLQSSTEDFSPRKNSPFRTKDKCKFSSQIPQIISPP